MAFENEGNSADSEHLFKKEEIAIFRGTDGLPFNLLKITKDYRYNVAPQIKIIGNVLVEFETLENGSVVFKEADQWRGASMIFAHILHDNDENFVTVHQTEREALTGRIYLMDTETYEELKTFQRTSKSHFQMKTIHLLQVTTRMFNQTVTFLTITLLIIKNQTVMTGGLDAIEAIVMRTFFLNLIYLDHEKCFLQSCSR